MMTHSETERGDSGLCCCVCVTSFERQLTPLRVDFPNHDVFLCKRDSGLCCCVCVTSFERQLTHLCVDFPNRDIFLCNWHKTSTLLFPYFRFVQVQLDIPIRPDGDAYRTLDLSVVEACRVCCGDSSDLIVVSPGWTGACQLDSTPLQKWGSISNEFHD